MGEKAREVHFPKLAQWQEGLLNLTELLNESLAACVVALFSPRATATLPNKTEANVYRLAYANYWFS